MCALQVSDLDGSSSHMTLLKEMVAFDTEFPGVVFSPMNIDKRELGKLPSFLNYNIIKDFDNVNATKIIQLGLALCDDKGSLPNFGTNFDVYNDIQNTESTELLKSQGINFDKNLKEGIDSADFAALMLKYGLLGNHSAFAWVTFHGAYDIAHLMKILIRQPLPLFDLKHMKFYDGLYGGLETVANRLGVERVAGKSHQAGSDTLLTLQTFRKFLGMQCVLHGLE
ncbi:hypothetical protein ACB092_04G096400 [Castanea dentata]